ncbi:MAG: GNAT family N-acetyltransferase [Treponema sp.]|nr:GNAT family N-acetyltransferase [Treponema sp.]
MDYEITDQISAEEYNELRKIVGWTSFTNEQAADGLEHTTHLCCFRKDGKAIALCRVLWDHLYVAFIADVIVRPEFQGKGLGRELMKDAMDFIRSKLKPGYKIMINLMAAQGKEDFYKKFGFISRPNERFGCGMCQWIGVDK